MTENAFPFDAETEDVIAERDNRRLLAIVAGVAALALLAFFVVLPMLSGDEEEAPVVARRPARTLVSPSPTAVVSSPAPVLETFNDTVGRDPFRPLYVAPVEGGGVPGAPGAPGAPIGGGGAPAPGGTGGGAGGTPAPGSGGTGGTGTGGTSGGSATVGGNRVSLIDVFTRDGQTYAQTRVGSTVYTPAVGDTFATNYQVLTASGECATFLYGDENFQLCEGQEVLK
ncbi:MAG TPA: hypothetical protein VNA14_03615 [Mycobacteriales bacterium]|nr:hypothetical protein [Mycobacteriales bacterium]